MRNACSVIVATVALFMTACATAGNPPPAAQASAAAQAPAAPGPGGEEIQFRGYRLLVQRDAEGKATSAQAYGPDKKPVVTHIVPMGDVKVCAPKPVSEGAGPGPQCEPFNFIPEGTSFKTGSNSICWYYRNGQLVYYNC